MERVILCSASDDLEIKNIKKYSEVPEDISEHVILLDVDTLGLSSVPDIIEDNIVIALTGIQLPGYTMKLMSIGFFDVINLPADEEEIYEKVKEGLRILEETRVYTLISSEEIPKGYLCEELCSIVGNPKNMAEAIRLAGKAASLDVPVLITGESGTGKELFARAIWKLSKRWQGPFVAINCSTIPENLFEAELFGYEKGAFTGATSRKKGLIEEANHGILFLDELGDMPLSVQTKLLRVLQEKKIRRIGGKEEIPVDVRVIGATNRDLEAMVREGKFREDLFFRLNVIHIYLPPLRDRKEDIPVLLECMIKKFSKEYGKRIKGYTKGFLETLLEYNWPGNVRELENVVKRAIALSSKNILSAKDIPDLKSIHYSFKETKGWKDILREEIKVRLSMGEEDIYDKVMAEVEKLLIEEAFRFSGNNQVRASKLLGINRLTLRRKLEAIHQNL